MMGIYVPFDKKNLGIQSYLSACNADTTFIQYVEVAPEFRRVKRVDISSLEACQLHDRN